MDERGKVMERQIVENDVANIEGRGCLRVASGKPFEGIEAIKLSSEDIETMYILQARKNQASMLAGIPQEKLKAIARSSAADAAGYPGT
jgi:hypothetical protein